MVESYSELDELEEAEETLAELKVMLAHHSEDAACTIANQTFL